MADVYDTPVIILAGGKSTRMGTDKMSLPLQSGETMLSSAANRFAAVFRRVYIASGEKAAVSADYPLINDIYPGLGPISGLHAALETLRCGVFLAAGDMPNTDPETAAKIIESAGGHMAAAAVTERGFEPLFAYYSAGLSEIIKQAISSGQYSLNKILRETGAAGFEVEKKTVLNINTPEEYAAL